MDNVPVHKVDILAFAGKWFTLCSIPTIINKRWRQTTETFVIHPDGYYAVFTAYHTEGEDERKLLRSKLFVVRGSKNTKFKSQVLWPFKVDYWVIELADDYSYVVIGHPNYKHLAILSRKPALPNGLLETIIARCKERGYDTSKLVSQQHTMNVTEPLAGMAF